MQKIKNLIVTIKDLPMKIKFVNKNRQAKEYLLKGSEKGIFLNKKD
jgi:hypothetical protein